MTEKTGKKYFVTGITGFAAPHLARMLLEDGHEVHGLIRGSNGREYDLLDTLHPEEVSAIRFHYGDLRDRVSISNIFRDNRFDGVFHLGAQSHPPTSFEDPVGTYKTNVMGTAHLIDAIQNHQPDCIFQFTSTSEIYGNQGNKFGTLHEDTPLKPSNPYGNSKAASDFQVQERCENGFLKGFVTRAFSHTGPRRGKNFSISWDAYHLAMIKNGKNPNKNIDPVDKSTMLRDPMKALPVGNLKTKRIVIDVKDCVRAYKMLMESFDESTNGEIYNVCGSQEDISEMERFTDTLIEISGLEGIIKVRDKRVFRPIDIQIQIGDTTKLKEKTKWTPEIPLKETLEELFNYWVKKTA
jgi:GDPmannose 4,6-dehydratase